MTRTCLVVASLATAVALVYPAHARADEEDLPRMDPDKDVTCKLDGDGRSWRLQCKDDHGQKKCLYAPNSELDEDGNFVRPLERARRCYDDGPFDQQALEAQGYTLIPAIADAPKGWMRDRRQRVFQVDFDLHRRLYAGVHWTPSDTAGTGSWDRAGLDFEIFEYEHLSVRGRGAYRHRLRILQGDVELAPFGADATLLHYDLSHKYADPLFRITTFFGTPHRYDIDAHLGGWFEIGHVSIWELSPGKDETLWRLGTAHLTWDLWRSSDMYSYIRLRGGVGLERAKEDGGVSRPAITPGAAFEGDITFDHAGHHHLDFQAGWERPTYYDKRRATDPSNGERAHVELGYELLLVAVNDQPITLRLAGEGDYRGDVPGLPARWDFRGIAGLRFSLWAPAR